MSSVVKKTSQFTPKVKRKSIRRKSVNPTPPTTQQTESTQESPVQTEESAVLATPPATQNTPTKAANELPTPLLNFAITTASSRLADEEDDVDPMLKVPPKEGDLAVIDADSDNEDYGDNDIFKQPRSMTSDSRRRSSVVNHRRLSTIGGMRRGSISLTPSAGPEGEEPQRSPFLIGIPQSKASRKRSMSTSRPGKRATRSISVPAEPVLERNESDNEEEEHEDNGDKTAIATSTQPPSAAPHEDIVVGLHPKTGKLTKFRASENVRGHKALPVAPEGLITTIEHISQLPRSISKEDEKYFAMVAVSPETLSMSDLCKPTLQIGSISERFDMAQEAKKNIAKRRDERRKARRLARDERISYEEALLAVQGNIVPVKKPDVEDSEGPAPEAQKNNVELNIVDGKILLNPESTVVSKGTASFGDREVEIDNPFENPITSVSYTKLAHTDAWTTDELVQLYNALSTWGTDFTFIAQLFPYRSRRQVKRKFILEEKKNPELVELALRRKLPANFESFCQNVSSSTTFKTVADFNAEMDDIRKLHEKHMEEINTERERAIKEDKEASRQREIEIRTGSKPMTKAEKIKELRKNETVVGTVGDVKRERGAR